MKPRIRSTWRHASGELMLVIWVVGGEVIATSGSNNWRSSVQEFLSQFVPVK